MGQSGFFFMRKPAYEMRISDWSSDVCSSDLIDQIQTALGRQMLLENPATYIWYQESTWREPDFIQAIAQRTGCGLLLDVNNVHVASTNQRWDAPAYMNDFPLGQVQQIHLAGTSRPTDEKGKNGRESLREKGGQ